MPQVRRIRRRRRGNQALEIFQLRHDRCDRCFELRRVPALVRGDRIDRHFDARRDTFVCDRPMMVRMIKRKNGTISAATIDLASICRDTKQSAPGAGTDELADAKLPERVRQKITGNA